MLYSQGFHVASRRCCMDTPIDIAAWFILTIFYLTLSFLTGGVIACFSKRTVHVKWILPTLAGALGALILGTSAPWPNVKSWNVFVLLGLIVWVVLDWNSKKLQKESLRHAYGATLLTAVLKSTVILVGCSSIAIATAPHHL